VQQILLFILLGLGPGALIAGIALGVVLTYRGSGVINLATGGVAMLAGYAFWALQTGRLFAVHVSQVPALALSLTFAVFSGVLIELVAFRPLRTAAPLAKMVSSLGVLLVAQACMLLAFGTTQQPEPSVLPQDTVSVLGTVIPGDRFILTGIVITVAIALAVLYRFTTFGLATRAASENEIAAMLEGLSPNRLSLWNTMLASLIAGAIGILAASITQLDSISLPLQIVPALAAALLAGFTSFGIACTAGLGIGIMYSLLDYLSGLSWFPTSGGVALPGVKELLTFLIIVAAMFVRGGRLPSRGELVERGLPLVPRPQRLLRTALPAAAICAVALVLLPFDFRQALINSLIGTVMALSLVVITGFVGQVSVVQLSLAGVCGFTISHLATGAGIGFPLGPLIGTAVAVGLGLLVAVSALRVRGVSLVVVTLAAAVAITNFIFLNSTWGGGASGSPVPEPHLLGLDIGPRASFRGLDGNLPSPVFGWLTLIATVGVCLLVGAVRRGRSGQRMLAVRSNERAAAAAATSPRTARVRHQRVHRGRRRGPVRLQLRLGQRRALQRGHRAQPDRVRLRRGDHAHLRRGVRGADLDRGSVPVRARQVAGDQRQLVSAVRWRDPDHHPDSESGRSRRGVLQANAQAPGDSAAARRRSSGGAARPASSSRPTRGPPGGAARPRAVGRLRRGARRRPRRSRRRRR
jgi:branched-chain amino acid transport system permease protein